MSPVLEHIKSARAQLEEADEQADAIRRAAENPTDTRTIAAVADARALYTARALEDMIGAVIHLCVQLGVAAGLPPGQARVLIRDATRPQKEPR